MAQLSFTNIDRISERVIEFYEQERDRWLHNRATVRAARVRALLAGDQFDRNATEVLLNYRLRQRHLGLVLWTRAPTGGQEELLVLERVAVRLAELLGHGRALFVPCDGRNRRPSGTRCDASRCRCSTHHPARIIVSGPPRPR